MAIVTRRDCAHGLTAAIRETFQDGDNRFLLAEDVRDLMQRTQRQKVADQVWKLIQSSYAYIGGFKGADDGDELARESHHWTVDVDEDGTIRAITAYKRKFGNKRYASASDGSAEGKAALKGILRNDLRDAWAEVSGRMESFLSKISGKRFYVPNAYAADLTGKPIQKLHDDGYHYTRLINGDPVEKIIIGTPQGLDINRNPREAKRQSNVQVIGEPRAVRI